MRKWGGAEVGAVRTHLFTKSSWWVCISTAQSQVSLSALSWQSPHADSGWRVRVKGKKLGEAGFWKAVKGLSSRWKAQKFGWDGIYFLQFSSVQSLSCVQLFVTPWITARQASLSITNSRSLPKPMSIESMMPSNHIIICHLLLLLLSIFPNIRVF